jgi:RNA polymerase sigma factor (sigma-70 family)
MEQTEDNVIDEQEILLRIAQVYLSRQLERNTPPNPIVTHFWEKFHRTYTPMVLQMVRHFCPDADLAEDIAQEVWVIIARKLPDFHGGDVRAWIGKIAHDKTVDFLRRKSKLPSSSPLDFSSDAKQFVEAEGNGSVGNDWRSEVVKSALKNLHPQIGELNFQIIQLHYWEGKTIPEIGAVMGMSANQVYARQKRVLQKLRVSLGRLLQET